MSVSTRARAYMAIVVGVCLMVGAVFLERSADGSRASSLWSAVGDGDMHTASRVFSGPATGSAHGRLMAGLLSAHGSEGALDVVIVSAARFARTHPGNPEAHRYFELLSAARNGLRRPRARRDALPASRGESAETRRRGEAVYAPSVYFSPLSALAYRRVRPAGNEAEGPLPDPAPIRGAPEMFEADAGERRRVSPEAHAAMNAGTPTMDTGALVRSASPTLAGASRETLAPTGLSPSPAVPLPLPETATGYMADMKAHLVTGVPPGESSAPAPDMRASGEPPASPKVAHRVSWWRWTLFAYAAAAAVLLAVLAIRALAKRLQGGDQRLERRLRRVAAPLAGPIAAVAQSADGESIFRSPGRRSRLGGLARPIESRYPLVDARRALPVAVGAGIAAAAFAGFSLWFLKVPAGAWALPGTALAGAVGAWYALAWQQAREESAFVRQFPEVVDQVVRLAGAGVPSVEALTVVAQDAPPPIRPILRRVCDALLGGVDPDTALHMEAARVRLAEFTMFAAVLRLQRRAGGGVSTAFANLAATLRERHKTALKARASTAQSRLTLLVLAVMPVVVLIAQKFISPQSVEVLFGTESGLTLLRVGTGLIVFGLFVARTIAARAAR